MERDSNDAAFIFGHGTSVSCPSILWSIYSQYYPSALQGLVNLIFVHSIHWNLIVAWTWTNRGSFWPHLDAFGKPVFKKSVSPFDEPCSWTLLHILWWTLILGAFYLWLSRNVFKVTTWFLGKIMVGLPQDTFWTHKHPDRTPFISVNPFTDLSVTVMQASRSVFEQSVIGVTTESHGWHTAASRIWIVTVS